jgi:hypothetical protein
MRIVAWNFYRISLYRWISPAGVSEWIAVNAEQKTTRHMEPVEMCRVP